MHCIPEYHQLVLFHCDEDRLSLFKDYQQYLPEIPSNCDCYIFWNDLKYPVQKKLRWMLRKYFFMHFCPSFSYQMKNPSTSNVLFFLNNSLCKYASILLVHDINQSYADIFTSISKQYGAEKMELYGISKPFSKHLPTIISLLRAKLKENNNNDSLTNASAQSQCRSFRSKCIWGIDDRFFPYDIEEKGILKHIIKSKQKSLKLSLTESANKITLEDSNLEVEDDYQEDYKIYLETMCESLKMSRKQRSKSISVQNVDTINAKITSVRNVRLWDFLSSHQQMIQEKESTKHEPLQTVNDMVNPLNEPTQSPDCKKHLPSVDKNTAKEATINQTKTKTERKARSVRDKNIRSISSNAQAPLVSTNIQSNKPDDKTKKLKPKLRVTNKKFNCPRCPRKFKSSSAVDQHFFEKHREAKYPSYSSSNRLVEDVRLHNQYSQYCDPRSYQPYYWDLYKLLFQPPYENC